MRVSTKSAPFVEIRISTSGDRGKSRRVPSVKMPRNPLFSSAEVNSACGFHLGNGFVSRTLPLLENHFVYSLKGDAFKASPFFIRFYGRNRERLPDRQKDRGKMHCLPQDLHKSRTSHHFAFRG